MPRFRRLATARRSQLAVVELLTWGQLSVTIAEASMQDVVQGGVGAYQRGVKQELLEVSDGPLVSQECVSEMAMGAAALLSAHVGLAITGVGGPGPDEGHEAGTVWIAVHAPLGTRSVLYHLRGNSPDEVCAASCTQAA